MPAAAEPAPAGCALEDDEGADDEADCALAADAAALGWLSVWTADLKKRRRWGVLRVSTSRSHLPTAIRGDPSGAQAGWSNIPNPSQHNPTIHLSRWTA